MEERISGLSASAGFAIGNAIIVHRPENTTRRQLSPAEEEQALKSAIAGAQHDIKLLIQRQTDDGADVLGFQHALLEDDALTEHVWASLVSGVCAETAWRLALDHEIAGYRASDDKHFAARAVDLQDIRDRVLAQLFGIAPSPDVSDGDILVADDIAPSTFLMKDWSKGGALVLGSGSPNSHVAMLARTRAIPMVVGIGDRWKGLAGPVIVSGDEAVVTINPAPATIAAAHDKAAGSAKHGENLPSVADEFAITLDGIKITVLVNITSMKDIADFQVDYCDGVGLVRTEFLIEGALHNEERQYQIYAELMRWAGGKPVTIRTIDAGADKPVSGYTVESETNPFLGMRGIRLSLANPDIFEIQLRALLRAAALGPLKIMLPMVTNSSDLEATRLLIEQCHKDLAINTIACGYPQLGIMVEVPAVALCVESFDADFFSIGSNDLTQYATAASRDSATVAAYADTLHPGVMFMISHVVKSGLLGNKQVSLCGDAAADPRLIEPLLKAGLRIVSVPPGLVESTKAAIRKANLSVGGAGQ
jgi:phosphoenolpyruvate-protein phosphotransferase (PTS system enzyme I)